MRDSEQTIEGRNAVFEAFAAGKTVDRLFVQAGCKSRTVQSILREAKRADTVVEFVEKSRLDQMSETGKHQGVVAYIAAYTYGTVEGMLADAENKKEPPFLVFLDGVKDPHNLGSVIRTANAAGAHGVVVPKRRAVGLTAAAAKASAGAVNYTPVAKVTNLVSTMQALKSKGMWFVCADMEGTPMTQVDLRGSLGIVIGAEGEGVSRLVRETCDFTAAIPMAGQITSLNASVAAGVLLYEAVRQRGEKTNGG